MQTFYIIPNGFVKRFSEEFVIYFPVCRVVFAGVVEFVNLDTKRVMYIIMNYNMNQVKMGCWISASL